MTTKIDIHTLYKIIKELPWDEEGFVSFTDFLQEASGFYNCTMLTVRNFVYKNPEKFDVNRGRIKVKLIETIVEQADDLKEFEEWMLNRTAVLDECLEFLGVQKMTPYLENLLVLAGNARDELKSYSNVDLITLIHNIEREFGFSPKTMLKEGGFVNVE